MYNVGVSCTKAASVFFKDIFKEDKTGSTNINFQNNTQYLHMVISIANMLNFQNNTQYLLHMVISIANMQSVKEFPFKMYM